jgi:uncharacterized peroxidase-related enzyme
MNLFKPQTIESAPAASKPILENIKKGFGFIPNLMATFAESPVVLEGYMTLDTIWNKGTLSPSERQLILLTASVENNCDYCKAAHSTIAKGMLKVSPEVVKAIREKSVGPNAKINALVNLTRELVAERGQASEKTVNAFLEQGYSKPQVMEILVGISLKTMSNYLDHLSPTPIDEAFRAEA